MHGLILETSIWLLAGSTRCSLECWPLQAQKCSQKYNSRFHKETVPYESHFPRQGSKHSFDWLYTVQASSCAVTPYSHCEQWKTAEIDWSEPGIVPSPAWMFTCSHLPILTGSGGIGCRPPEHPPLYIGIFCENGSFFPGEKPKNRKSKSKSTLWPSNPKVLTSAKKEPQRWNPQGPNFDFDFDFWPFSIFDFDSPAGPKNKIINFN